VFDAFVAQWIFGTALPELELSDVNVTDAAGALTTTTELRNIGNGVVDVVVRVMGASSEEIEDVVVRVAPNTPASVVVSTSFTPTKIVVDPEVRVLFAGRKRCEKSL
jgi:hypothetical protein